MDVDVVLDKAFKDLAPIDGVAAGMKEFAALMGSFLMGIDGISGDVVEVGVRTGRTGLFLARVLEHIGSNKHVWGIDPFYSSEEKHFASFVKHRTVVDITYRYHLICATSREAYNLFYPRKVSFVFVDGDHSFEAVNWDTENWFKVLSPRGIISLDDVFSSRFPGPGRVLREIEHGVLPNLKVVAKCKRGVILRKFS